MTWSVRRALLDVSGPTRGSPDGEFDSQDLSYFTEMFVSDADPWTLTRFDLNGDGRVGGGGSAPLDLSASDPPVFERLEREIEGGNRSFDETSVTDEEALCFWAYGALYDGDNAPRTELLDQLCAVSYTSEIRAADPLKAGVPTELEVVVWQGGAIAQDVSVEIEVDPVLAAVAATSGRTGLDGAFRTRVVPLGLEPVVVTARVVGGGETLLEEMRTFAVEPPVLQISAVEARANAFGRAQPGIGSETASDDDRDDLVNYVSNAAATTAQATLANATFNAVATVDTTCSADVEYLVDRETGELATIEFTAIGSANASATGDAGDASISCTSSLAISLLVSEDRRVTVGGTGTRTVAGRGQFSVSIGGFYQSQIEPEATSIEYDGDVTLPAGAEHQLLLVSQVAAVSLAGDGGGPAPSGDALSTVTLTFSAPE